MASVDWCKATLQKASALIRHNGKEERVNGNHSNPDIDKSKSHLNVYIGANDYRQMYAKVKTRVAEVDRENPPLRNQGDRRITCILLETPVPQAITEQGKAADFLNDVHQVFNDFFGAENVGGTCGHFDEQHWYKDKDGAEKLSLVHGHTLVAAYAEWTDKNGNERKGINGKNCETKARLKALNKAMNDMCLERYGISYNTYTEPQRKTVEQLKAEGKNVKESIPPFTPEPYPEKPELPEKYQEQNEPVNYYPNYSRQYKNFDKELGKWQKERDKKQAEIDKQHQKNCAVIDSQNALQRQEWERKYLTADKLTELADELANRKAELDKQEKEIPQKRKEILKAARQKADEIVQDAQQKIQAEQDALEALKSARRELMQSIRDSLPSPPIEAAQRAIECAQRTREKRIKEIISENQKETEKPIKTTYERD